MAGVADRAIGAHEAAGVARGEIVLAYVQSGVKQHGEIGAVVDDPVGPVKDTLDAGLLSPDVRTRPKRFANAPAGFAALVAWADRHAGGQPVHFCLEATGPYSAALAAYLHAAGRLVSVVNPTRVKAHAKACGQANKTDPADARHIPGPGADGVALSTPGFSLINSGNRTLHAPKRSWKITLEHAEHGGNHLAGMTRVNLKSMYNDPSQMREALAWRLFRNAGVPAARHTYAKLAFDATYYGLFSVIEQVDKRFLKDHFGDNDRGNLYKAYCGDVGCATLQHRAVSAGDDSGRLAAVPEGERPGHPLLVAADAVDGVAGLTLTLAAATPAAPLDVGRLHQALDAGTCRAAAHSGRQQEGAVEAWPEPFGQEVEGLAGGVGRGVVAFIGGAEPD